MLLPPEQPAQSAELTPLAFPGRVGRLVLLVVILVLLGRSLVGRVLGVLHVAEDSLIVSLLFR